MEKCIYPVEDGCHYGEVLYGYTDLEEAKKDYKELTGEDLDVDNIQHVNVEILGPDDNITLSWADQEKGVPSMLCIY